jgi:hypothetical protein
MMSFTVFQSRPLSGHCGTDAIDSYRICIWMFVGDMLLSPELEWLGILFICSDQPIVLCRSADDHGHLVELNDRLEKTLMNLLDLCGKVLAFRDDSPILKYIVPALVIAFLLEDILKVSE